MLTSSVNGNGLPPDLEFSLDEISTELAKLGVRETSPTRLAAIKTDLDKLIARDLDKLSGCGVTKSPRGEEADEDDDDDPTLQYSWSDSNSLVVSFLTIFV